jgi:septum formation protein
LNLVRIRHRVLRPSVNEKDHAHEDPARHVLRLASLKARSVLPRVKRGTILGADTIVVHDGDILGKPTSKREARRMLGRLAGKWHTVFTGLAVLDAKTGLEAAGYERSEVKIRKMTPAEIEAYVATGEPMDKAGSYGIQGYGAGIVESVRGCYFNVVGLPIVRLVRLIRELEGDLKKRGRTGGRKKLRV